MTDLEGKGSGGNGEGRKKKKKWLLLREKRDSRDSCSHVLEREKNDLDLGTEING